MNPDIKSVIENNDRRYALVSTMKRLVTCQLNGQFDSIRSRALWSSHLPELVEGDDLELMAEAITEALDDIRRKLSTPLIS
ncbi:hypothetical protein [Aeromonas rivipollensis]|uniref:hypothetical protein n=1 Tax=Aeromonas rivipollensis TaxID=948519 RepID=UPI0038D1A813